MKKKLHFIKKLWQISWVGIGNPKCRAVVSDDYKVPISAFRIVVQSIWEKGRLDMTIFSWSLPLACCLPRWLSLCFVNVGIAPASLSAFLYLVRCLLIELTHNFCSHYGLYCKFSKFPSSSSVAFSRLLIHYLNSQPSNITSNSLRVQKREKNECIISEDVMDGQGLNSP